MGWCCHCESLDVVVERCMFWGCAVEPKEGPVEVVAASCRCIVELDGVILRKVCLVHVGMLWLHS